MLDNIYSGPKAALRPVHDRLMDAIIRFGDFKIAPKKGSIRLRRKKQFAMIDPAIKSRVELGLNMKDVEPSERLVTLPPGDMCQYRVGLTEPGEADPEFMAWIRRA